MDQEKKKEVNSATLKIVRMQLFKNLSNIFKGAKKY